jgi:hypothetical protein
MIKSNAYLSVLLAGLLAAAGVQAQTALPGGSSDTPPKAGEASTQTQGVPNAATTNSPVSEVPISTKDQIRQGAQVPGGAAPTSAVPVDAGEASTVVRGKPNADPNDPSLSKTARAAQMMGHTGYGVEVGTPRNAPAGTPSVFRGGTPQ